MRDDDFVEFLQWALPRLEKRWSGFEKPRGQVKRRVANRLRELALRSLTGYREKLQTDPSEWAVLDQMTRVTISEFYREPSTWNALRSTVLPELVNRGATAGRGRR